MRGKERGEYHDEREDMTIEPTNIKSMIRKY